MKRLLAALLLVALLPGVQAAEGVELQPDPASKDLAVTAQAGQAVQATVAYTLDLAAATPLRLLSGAKDGAGGPVAHNATWRLDGNVVGTTSGTSTLLVPTVAAGSHPLVATWALGTQAGGQLQLQAFVRREVSGSGGSASGVAGAIAQTALRITRSGQAVATVAPATAGGATPVVIALSFDRRAEGTSLSWGTSVPAASVVLVQGPAGSAQRSLPANVRFTADLGALPDGLYGYNITATDTAGRVGYLAGEVRLEGTGSGAPIAPPLVQALGQSLQQPLRPGSVFLVDQDRDGRPDHLVDAAGLTTQVRALPQQGRFVLHSIDSEALFLLEANTGNVRPVQAVTGTLGKDTATGDSRHVQVGVGEKVGWILVTVPDPHPGEALLGAQRGDGTPLPRESVWQGNGVVQFVDDPAAAYTLLYSTPPATGISLGTAAALAGGGLLVGALLMLLVRRRVQ
jgi:hypothetical protein